MEELKDKEERKTTDLVVVKQKKNYEQENKVLKVFLNIIYAISKLILKLTVIVAIYSAIFSIVAYHSNKYVVEKLRESESNKKVDPVLEELRKDKNNENNGDKTKEDKEKDDKKENDTEKKEDKKKEEKKNTTKQTNKNETKKNSGNSKKK